MTTTSPLSLTPRTEPDPLDALGYPLPTEEDALEEPCEAPADAATADRMLYAAGRLLDRLAEVRQVARAQRERADLFEQEEGRKIKARYDWLARGIEGWAAAVHKADPSRKTIVLPNGKVEVRPRQSRLEVQQADLDLFRQTRPGWVREKLEPEKNAIKAAVVAGMKAEIGPEAPEGYAVHHAADKETGEIVFGVYLLVPTSKQITVVPS